LQKNQEEIQIGVTVSPCSQMLANGAG